MSETIAVALPLFGLVGLGYGIGRWFRVPPGGVAGLVFFVNAVALPLLFFRFVAGAPAASLASWSFILTTTFSTYCAFAMAFSFGALFNRGNVPEATIQGLVGAYGNIGGMAPAVAVAALGEAAGLPAALIFVFDNAMLLAIAPLMMTLGGTERPRFLDVVREVGRDIVRQPITVSVAIGAVFAVIGIGLPAPVDRAVGFVSSAAAPAALFTIGLGLAQRPLGRVTADIPVLVLAKLVIHPAIVYLLLSWIGGFEPVWVYAAVLVAALPPSANVLGLARQYRAYRRRAATAIILGTVASLVTLTVAVALITLEILPIDPFG
jgi:predicted permease